MTAGMRHTERRLLLAALGVLGASTAIGAALGASRLGLVVPPASSGSPRDVAVILVNNLEICVLLTALALLQPRGVANLTRGFLPLWLTDLTAALVVVLNLAAIGGVVGALGLHALARMAPHAPFEIGGYLALVVAYLRARRGALGRREALNVLGLAVVLLSCAAVVESYVSGALL